MGHLKRDKIEAARVQAAALDGVEPTTRRGAGMLNSASETLAPPRKLTRILQCMQQTSRTLDRIEDEVDCLRQQVEAILDKL